jgi:hypothetical protein
VDKYGGAREATVDNIIRHMGFACWITKATHTHTERPSVLRCTYIACVVLSVLVVT